MSALEPTERTYANPQPGDVLAGKYRIEYLLGKGGMGVVVAATHLQLGQRVAIKYLIQPDNVEIVTRFLREARALARLRSEHVTRVLDVGELDNGAPYMVMEYLQGMDLARHVRQDGPLPVSEAIDYVLQTCEAMAEAHAQGIVHRDLKPANLFLTITPDDSKVLKVLDFGISKVSEDEAKRVEGMQLTSTEAVIGSPYYMSPEQLKASKNVDARGDIWSLGVILYQLVAGKVPFPGSGVTEVVLKVTLEQPAPLSDYRDDVPPEVEVAILKCLEKKRENRFNNVAELALALAPFGLPSANALAEKAKRLLESAGIVVRTGAGMQDVEPPARPVFAASTVKMHQASASSVPEPGIDTQASLPTVPLPKVAQGDGQRTKRASGIVVGAIFALSVVVLGGVSIFRSSMVGHDEPRPAAGDKPLTTREEKPTPEVKPLASLLSETVAASVSASAAPSPLQTPTSSTLTKNPTNTRQPKIISVPTGNAVSTTVAPPPPPPSPAPTPTAKKNPLQSIGIE